MCVGARGGAGEGTGRIWSTATGRPIIVTHSFLANYLSITCWISVLILRISVVNDSVVLCQVHFRVLPHAPLWTPLGDLTMGEARDVLACLPLPAWEVRLGRKGMTSVLIM
jgi:hypothetical protein